MTKTMSKVQLISWMFFYLASNFAVYWLVDNRYLGSYASINVIFSFMFSEMIFVENFLLSSFIYLMLSSILFCIVAQFAVKVYEVIILLILVLSISVPFLNFNGL